MLNTIGCLGFPLRGLILVELRTIVVPRDDVSVVETFTYEFSFGYVYKNF